MNKGIITEDDAAEVRAEIANIRQEEEAARKSYSVTGKRPIKVGGYLQERYTHSSQEDFQRHARSEADTAYLSAEMRRRRLDFKVQVDFAGSKKGRHGVDFTTRATTAYFGKAAAAGRGDRLQAGGRQQDQCGSSRFPFSMENLTSSPLPRPDQQIADRGGSCSRQRHRRAGPRRRRAVVRRKSFGRRFHDSSSTMRGLFNGSGINVADDNDRKDPALRTGPAAQGSRDCPSELPTTTARQERPRRHPRPHGRRGSYAAVRGLSRASTSPAKTPQLDKKGWYATLVRQFNPIVQGVVRVRPISTPNTGAANDITGTLTAGLNYFLNKDGYSRWQLNYERKKDDSTGNGQLDPGAVPGGILRRNEMRRLIAVFATLAVLAGLSATSTYAAESGRISLSGAWAIYPLAVKWAEAFKKTHPNVRIDISAGGAGKGMADALSGAVDIGMVSREVDPSEAKRGAFPVFIAKDGVFVTVSERNPAIKGVLSRGISRQALVEAYINGKTTTWRKLAGGPAAPVHIYTRSDACGAASAFAAFLGKYKQDNLKGIGVYGDPGLLEAVRRDPLGIGYNNLGFVFTSDSPARGVKIVPIDANRNGRVDPHERIDSRDKAYKEIASGRYPGARREFFVTKGKPKGIVKEFIQFALSDAGVRVLKERRRLRRALQIRARGAVAQGQIDRVPAGAAYVCKQANQG